MLMNDLFLAMASAFGQVMEETGSSHILGGPYTDLPPIYPSFRSVTTSVRSMLTYSVSVMLLKIHMASFVWSGLCSRACPKWLLYPVQHALVLSTPKRYGRRTPKQNVHEGFKLKQKTDICNGLDSKNPTLSWAN